MNTRVPPSTAALPLRETKYRELEQYPEFGSVTAWLRDVVSSIVPNARMSECEYWSVVCLPAGDPDDPRKPLVSVHAGNMAVAGVFLDLSDGQRRLAGYVRVSGAELEKASGSTREQLVADSPTSCSSTRAPWCAWCGATSRPCGSSSRRCRGGPRHGRS